MGELLRWKTEKGLCPSRGVAQTSRSWRYGQNKTVWLCRGTHGGGDNEDGDDGHGPVLSWFRGVMAKETVKEWEKAGGIRGFVLFAYLERVVFSNKEYDLAWNFSSPT